MPIRQNFEIGDLVVVDGDTTPVYGRIVGRWFNRDGAIFDVQPEGTRDLKSHLREVHEHRITHASGEVARMVATYNKQVSEEPKHVKDEI